MKKEDVIIIGGGLAGLTGAIHLKQEGISVTVFEKQRYPHHKVCGEYVSNEIVPYLDSLGISLLAHGGLPINRMQLTTVKGKSLETELPLGGIGISRFAFDDVLYRKALSLGVTFVFEAVTNILFEANSFEVYSKSNIFSASLVIGAYGKRATLDKKLSRDFINEKSAWLGVKAHYKLDAFPSDLVALHNFKGGYGGLSKTESNSVNFCYLARYERFKKAGTIKAFNEQVVSENPFLHQFLKDAEPLFNEPLTIAQISFQQKQAVENHVLMCGDTAGLIHPLCGNGMAMAIHSAKIASELICTYVKIKSDRRLLEQEYQLQWKAAFEKRLRMGRVLQSLLLNDTLSSIGIDLVSKSPKLLNTMIKKTHGTVIAC